MSALLSVCCEMVDRLQIHILEYIYHRKTLFSVQSPQPRSIENMHRTAVFPATPPAPSCTPAERPGPSCGQTVPQPLSVPPAFHRAAPAPPNRATDEGRSERVCTHGMYGVSNTGKTMCAVQSVRTWAKRSLNSIKPANQPTNHYLNQPMHESTNA